MHPVPIPAEIVDAAAEARGAAATVVIGEPGMSPADDGAPMPVEYLVVPSRLYPGRPCLTALVELDDADRAAIAAGSRLLLTFDGGEVPWSVAVEDLAG